MERLSIRQISVASAIAAGSLLLGACGDSDAKPKEDAQEHTGVKGLFGVKHTYENGQRMSVLSFNDYDKVDVIAYCEGGDLVEYYNGGREGGPSRSVNHQACNDERLEPADFETPVTTSTTLG